MYQTFKGLVSPRPKIIMLRVSFAKKRYTKSYCQVSRQLRMGRRWPFFRWSNTRSMLTISRWPKIWFNWGKWLS